jgi:hypothetical protein
MHISSLLSLPLFMGSRHCIEFTVKGKEGIAGSLAAYKELYAIYKIVFILVTVIVPSKVLIPEIA